ncbi:MAG TPA: PAS domain-containing protein [Dehalococcoidia bacterium]|nr:PAS domain-containing protein [Dehalococcoidia bacterium]
MIERAYTEGHTVLVENIAYQQPDDEEVQLDLRVMPLPDVDAATIGVSIAFSNMTRYYQAQGEAQSYRAEVERANEELQSTVEELETTNEELQSANEEMETMNEELQATNEELQTMNDQLRQRSDELTEVNDYLDSILASVQVGIVVLDWDLVVRDWNPKARDLWGLTTDEVEGKSLVALDIGLPVERLVEPINHCLRRGGEAQQMVLAAVNRRGQNIQCWVSCSPMVAPHGEVRGAILLMEERDETGTASR